MSADTTTAAELNAAFDEALVAFDRAHDRAEELRGRLNELHGSLALRDLEQRQLLSSQLGVAHEAMCVSFRLVLDAYRAAAKAGVLGYGGVQ